MAVSGKAPEGFATLVSVYRQVLRVHREKLPGPLRSLGDAYVRNEVQSHLKAKTTAAQWKTFDTEWRSYLQMMNGQGGSTHLPPGLDGAGDGSSSRNGSGSVSSHGGNGGGRGFSVGSGAAGGFGSSRELPDEVLQLMTVEQRARMQELRQEAERLARGDGKGKDDPTGLMQ